MSGSYQKRILRGRIYLFSDALWIIIISFKNITGNYLDIFSVRALGGKSIIMLFPPNFLLMPKIQKSYFHLFQGSQLKRLMEWMPLMI